MVYVAARLAVLTERIELPLQFIQTLFRLTLSPHSSLLQSAGVRLIEVLTGPDIESR